MPARSGGACLACFLKQRIRQAARNIRRFFDTADKTLHNVVPMAKVG
ncbi:MAG TPA: hypothetical protein VF744_11290 [Beijerinckiaceae bacterium]